METIVLNSLLALLVAFGVAALLGPLVIPILHRLKFGQNVRDDGPKTHLKKQNTPTMGGVMILIAVVAATLIFAHRNYSLAVWALLFTVLFGLIGFLDDFIKIVKKRSLGLRAWQKIVAQFVLALGKPDEVVILEDAEGGNVKYYRDARGVHHAPKRTLEDIIVK